MLENTPSRFHGFSWTAVIADGMTAGLIALAILIAMTALGADVTDPFGVATAQREASPHFG